MGNRVRNRRGLAALAMSIGLGGHLDAAEPLTTIRDGFEGPKTSWRQEETDAPFKIFSHERTKRAAREGQLSEGFQFEAGIGGGLYFSYALPKVPITEDLKVGLYVRSNRSGVQVLGRVVLPGDVDPDSRRPSFLLVSGTIYEMAERWEKIEITDMMGLVERQAKVLRASTRRKVSLEGAYLERLVVNIYGGEGDTEVYLDDLTVGPVPASIAAEASRMTRGDSKPGGPSARTIADRPRSDREPVEPALPGGNARIKIDRNRLLKDGLPWFPTIMRAPEADPMLIRKIGCDVFVVPKGTDDAVIRSAIANGLFLIPELNTGLREAQLPDADRMVADAVAFPGRGQVFAWSLGDHLGRSPDMNVRDSAKRKVRDAAVAIHKARPGGTGLSTGSVVGELQDYARVPENLDIIEIPAADWATTRDPIETYQYLDQRRLLTARGNPDAPFFAQIDVTPPSIYADNIWGTDRPPAWGSPRIQPEQIRTAAYAAITAGCRGICFNADGDLSQGPGRMGTIEVALLNAEWDLLEPILADADKAVRLIDTYLPDPPPLPPVTLFQMNTSTGLRPPTPKEFPPNPTVKAAAITTKDRRGTLLMVADYYKYAQFQPPQLATNDLKLLIPAARDAHAYLITPAGVKPLPDEPNSPGGHKITLPDFGVSAIVLVTTNVELKDQIERAVMGIRSVAVKLAIEQAELHRAWVAEIDYELQLNGHAQKDSAELFASADKLIASARDALEREDYQLAWDEARRVARPLRILMRYHFMAAYDALTKALRDEDLPCGPVSYEGKTGPQPRIIAPIAIAPLASFSTLPQAWEWIGWIKTGKLGKNALPSGNFNFKDVKAFGAAGWTEDSYTTDDLTTTVGFKEKGGPDKGGPDETGSNLVLAVNLRQGLKMDDLPPFIDHPVVAVRSPAIPVKAREVYRVSVMAYMANQTVGGAGGLIVRDSIGGERLQFRTPQALAMDWFEIVYYRRVPRDGKMTVTLGMAGYGFSAFDDLKVEPIVDQLSPDQLRASIRPRRRPAPAAPATSNTGDKPVAKTANRMQPMPIRQ